MEGNYPSARGRERARQDSPWLASQCCYAVVRSEREGGRKGWREGGKEWWGRLKERERAREAWQTVGEAEASSAVLCAEGALNSLSKGEGEGGEREGDEGKARGGERS